MTVKELRREAVTMFSRIPSFIDTTSSVDHVIWNKMGFASDILLMLISDTILKDNKIKSISNQFDMELQIILEETDKFHYVSRYFTIHIKRLLDISIEEEQYEVATNIRNFVSIYKSEEQ